MAKLSEIIAELNDDVTVQFLNQSMVSIKDKKRTKDTEITFATKVISANDFDGDETALIVWVSKSKFNNAIKNLDSRSKNDTQK